jgi:uncharacterized protein DUF4189
MRRISRSIDVADMKTLMHVIAIAAAVALASPVGEALAQGKGMDDTPGGGGGGREAPAQSEPTPSPSPREERPAPPADRWNSVASAIWHVRGRVRVAIGYSGARASADDAKSIAINACKDAGGSGCKALGAWNSGCVYITTGHTGTRAGWASGATSEAATAKCRGNGFTCKTPIGGCVD